jgi:hypothetical protein
MKKSDPQEMTSLSTAGAAEPARAAAETAAVRRRCKLLVEVLSLSNYAPVLLFIWRSVWGVV